MERSLYYTSIGVIRANQSPSGAYVASPAFANYAYCWMRDGTFIAYAMDVAGHHDSARAFHRWAARAIRSRRALVDGLLRSGQAPGGDVGTPLPTRFTLDGGVDESQWPLFQLDGYGAWLWGLAEHVRLTGTEDLLDEAGEAVEIVLAYLAALWKAPNYDCWEEHGDRVHTSTLACIAGGVRAMEPFTPPAGRQKVEELAACVREFVLEHGVVDGRLSKFCDAGDDTVGRGVDGSLLWAAVPFGTLEPGDPRMVRTVEAIERELVFGGGVHRYRTDTYYGGGLWLLLSAWLGWYYARAGRRSEAETCLRWIEAQADEQGRMPEQTGGHLLDPASYEPWVRRWGPVAKPLLWSHAMYLVLWHELRAV